MSDYSREFYLEKAIAEVERLARELVEKLGGKLSGECQTECCGSQECGSMVTIEATCPKCAEKFEVEGQCDADVECHEECESEIEVDVPSEVNDLRLALVQLDLAREAIKPDLDRFDRGRNA